MPDGVQARHEVAVARRACPAPASAHAGHDAHVGDDVGRIGDLDADVGDVGSHRTHAERDHVHRAPLHAAGRRARSASSASPPGRSSCSSDRRRLPSRSRCRCGPRPGPRRPGRRERRGRRHPGRPRNAAGEYPRSGPCDRDTARGPDSRSPRPVASEELHNWPGCDVAEKAPEGRNRGLSSKSPRGRGLDPRGHETAPTASLTPPFEGEASFPSAESSGRPKSSRPWDRPATTCRRSRA